MVLIDRAFLPIVAAGLAIPFALGYLVTGRLAGALTALALGRTCARLPVPPRHLQRQLHLPFLRPPAVRDRRPLDQRVLAGSAVDGRGLAQQPPRLPAVGLPRPALVGARRLGLVIRAMRRARSRLERGRGLPHSSAPAARRSRPLPPTSPPADDRSAVGGTLFPRKSRLCHRMAETPLHNFLFADISGYSRLSELGGDEVAADLAIRFASLAAEMAPEHGAEVVKRVGDAVMLHAESASSPDRAGAAPARGAWFPAPDPRGDPFGPRGRRAGDWWGCTVNIAARVADAAGAGQLLDH